VSDWRTKKGTVPLRYWVLWWSLIVVADFIFYVLLTPIWIGLRAVAWVADRWGQRKRTSSGSSPSTETR
jgi:hypothetical protein